MSLGWIDEICTRVTKELVDTNKPFKYLGKTLYFLLLFLYNYRLNMHISSSFLCRAAEEWGGSPSWSLMLLGRE